MYNHVPCRGSTTHIPCRGSTTNVPCRGSTTHIPCRGSTTHVPCRGSTTHVPCRGSTTHVPFRGSTTHVSQRYRRYCPCPLFCSPITQPYCPILVCKTQNDFEGELCLCLLIPSPLAKCPQLTIKLYRYTV